MQCTEDVWLDLLVYLPLASHDDFSFGKTVQVNQNPLEKVIIPLIVTNASAAHFFPLSKLSCGPASSAEHKL